MQEYNQYSRRKCWKAISFLFLLSTAAFAGGIKGTVTSSGTHEKLPGVSVVTELNSGTATDGNGEYKLELQPGKHTLTFSLLSYQSQTMTVVVADTGYIKVDIRLADLSKTLGVVVISA